MEELQRQHTTPRRVHLFALQLNLKPIYVDDDLK